MTALDRATLALTSWFGLGYLPKAPGTWGTLGALPLWWALSRTSWPVSLAATAVLIALAIATSARAETLYGSHDVGKIVIDEVAGFLITVIGVPFGARQAVAAFLLFRLFDILKPWPIRWADRRVGGGFGVVLDDLIAGAFACALLHAGLWAWPLLSGETA